MPDTYRYPRIIFPDMAETSLFSRFQPNDKNYILPEGERFFVPFDRSYLDTNEGQLISVPLVSSGRYIRVPRIHLWLEPCDKYPRGTRIQFRAFISGTIVTNVFLYVGRYYILPIRSASVGTVDGIQQEYPDDMMVFLANLVRMRFAKGDGTLLPTYDGEDIDQDLPVFSGLVEVL